MSNKLTLVLIIALSTTQFGKAQQQSQQPPPPISSGGQPTGGTGITQEQADITPEQMAEICNKRAVLQRRHDSLQEAVNSDYSTMNWAGADFQKETSDFEGWASRVEDTQRIREEREAIEDALRPGSMAIEIAKEGPLIALLKEEVSWAYFNVLDAATGQIQKHKIEALSRMTEDQLKMLKQQQYQMKQDVLSFKEVSTKLQGLASCDTTKLVIKEPGPEQPTQTASATPAKTPRSTSPAHHGHTGLIVGGVLAGVGVVGVAAAVAAKSNSSASCSSLENQCSNLVSQCLNQHISSACSQINSACSQSCQCQGFSGFNTGTGSCQ